jgi:site-specific DNA-methyltransferase (adenine-specific)
MIICDDSRDALLNYTNQIDLIMTSPPYADARKSHYDSIDPEIYPIWFMSFHEAFWNALKPEGSLIINIKDKIVNGVRHRYVWETMQILSKLGWHCIDDYIWHKTNPIPGFWPNRLRDGWEYCFHLSKTKRPFFNSNAVKLPAKEKSNSSNSQLYEHSSGFRINGANFKNKTQVSASNVVSIGTVGESTGHPAAFHKGLPEFFIKLLCPENGLVCDPFSGSGSTALAAIKLDRRYLLIDNKIEYCDIAQRRINNYLVKSA